MSCPQEASLLRYADRELTGDALHALESHLVGCRGCRTRVVALEGESQWLADVLQERERRGFVHAPVAAPEPGVALGVPVTIALVTAALAVGGALMEISPGGIGWMNPLRLMGASEMAFDVFFMLRSRAPGLFELCLSLAAVASVSALLSLAVGALGRRVFGAAALVLACLAWPESGRAFELRHQHEGVLRVGADERVEGTLVASSEVLLVEGTVDGDLIVTAERVTVAGTVRGSLYTFAKRVEITGTVTGSVIGLVESTDVDGGIEGSLYLCTGHLTLGPSGRVGRDLALASNEGALAGRVARDVFYAGERLELRGEVGRNVTARWGIDRVTLLDAARIGGDIDAWLNEPADLERAPGAQVAGEVRTHESATAREHYMDAWKNPTVWALHAVGLVAAFLFGLLIHILAPGLLHADLSTTRQLFSALGWGFVALLLTPLALLALALTLVGIPIAAFGFFAYVTAVYLAEIVIAAWLGRLIWPPNDASLLGFARALGVGLVVVVAAEHVPFVGVPIWSVVVLLGLGVLASRARTAILGERGALAF
jgi:cytoskeletal protein CcmA (bactofilin family)